MFTPIFILKVIRQGRFNIKPLSKEETRKLTEENELRTMARKNFME